MVAWRPDSSRDPWEFIEQHFLNSASLPDSDIYTHQNNIIPILTGTQLHHNVSKDAILAFFCASLLIIPQPASFLKELPTILLNDAFSHPSFVHPVGSHLQPLHGDVYKEHFYPLITEPCWGKHWFNSLIWATFSHLLFVDAVLPVSLGMAHELYQLNCSWSKTWPRRLVKAPGCKSVKTKQGSADFLISQARWHAIIIFCLAGFHNLSSCLNSVLHFGYSWRVLFWDHRLQDSNFTHKDDL